MPDETKPAGPPAPARRTWEIKVDGRTVRFVQTAHPGSAEEARQLSERFNDPLPADAEIIPRD